ncbi:MAG: CAP domain-containing protein [Planctomycetes bacterium]|nr:CAP domain-containing protein [Planctomycetota bacterium]
MASPLAPAVPPRKAGQVRDAHTRPASPVSAAGSPTVPTRRASHPTSTHVTTSSTSTLRRRRRARATTSIVGTLLGSALVMGIALSVLLRDGAGARSIARATPTATASHAPPAPVPSPSPAAAGEGRGGGRSELPSASAPAASSVSAPAPSPSPAAAPGVSAPAPSPSPAAALGVSAPAPSPSPAAALGVSAPVGSPSPAAAGEGRGEGRSEPPTPSAPPAAPAEPVLTSLASGITVESASSAGRASPAAPATPSGAATPGASDPVTTLLARLAAARTPAERAHVYDALADFGASGRAALRAALADRRAALLDQLRETPDFAAVFRLQRAKLDLFEARAEALRRIADRERYTKHDGQPEIDEALAEVARVAAVPGPALARPGPDAATRLAETADLDARARALGDSPQRPHWLAVLALAAARPAPLTWQDFPLPFETFDLAAENARILTANLALRDRMTRDEWDFVADTNAYRVRLGRRALRISLELREAARGHSREMGELDYFSHDSPVPAHAGPGTRARLAGFTGRIVGEAISAGNLDGHQEFAGLTHSAPHHRTLLASVWTCIGAGRVGDRWTINYGAAEATQGSH